MPNNSWIYYALFVLLAVITFFLIGILCVLILGLAEGQGLAGGAIVLVYGLVGGGIGLVLSIFVISLKKKKLTNTIIKILIVVVIGLISYFYWNYQTNVKPKRDKARMETGRSDLDK